MSFLSYAGIAFFIYTLSSAIIFVGSGVINAPLFGAEQLILAGQIAAVVIPLATMINNLRQKN